MNSEDRNFVLAVAALPISQGDTCVLRARKALVDELKRISGDDVAVKAPPTEAADTSEPEWKKFVGCWAVPLATILFGIRYRITDEGNVVVGNETRETPSDKSLGEILKLINGGELKACNANGKLRSLAA